MKKQIFALASIVMIAGAMTFTSCNKEDITAPVITITGGNTLNHILNAAFTAPAATATDDEDGDLSTSISVDASAVNVNLAGTYNVTYTVTDAAGNTATSTLEVTVYNEADWLSGSYNGADTCQTSGNFTYTATFIVSTTTNNSISVNNFDAFGTGINVNITMNGTAITVPAQPVGTVGNILSGTGNVVNTTSRIIHISFTWTDGTNTESCQSWLTHQ